MKQKLNPSESEQIKRKLAWLSENQDILARPEKGWFRMMRKILGMTGLQVAQKIGVSQPRIMEIEKAEINDSTTLKTMRAVAEAMNCRFEYVFVPRKPVDLFLKERAYDVTRSKVERLSAHMKTEKQGLSRRDQKILTDLLVEDGHPELVRTAIRQLCQLHGVLTHVVRAEPVLVVHIEGDGVLQATHTQLQLLLPHWIVVVVNNAAGGRHALVVVLEHHVRV